MSFRELFRTALHSLRINPIRSTLAILGVVFGVGAVVVLISMGQGVKTQISDQVRGLGTDLIIVKSGTEPKNQGQTLAPSSPAQLGSSNLQNDDAEALRTREMQQYVSFATATIELGETASAEEDSDRTQQVKVIGADSQFEDVRPVQIAYPKRWNYRNEKDGHCAIGQAVKQELFPKTTDAAIVGKQRIVVHGIAMTVDAITVKKEKSLIADPNLNVYVTLNDARKIFGGDNTSKVIEVYAKAADASRVKEAKAEVKRALENSHKNGNPVYVVTQDDLVSSYNKIFSILTALVLGVALVALAESGIGVSNIMYIAVKERTREIGVRLAQGASSRAILTQFLFESVTLCLMGSAIGIPLGWFVAFLINKYTVLPAQTPWWAVLVAFGAGTLVGVIAGVYPAWQATKSDIAVVLRSE